MIIFISLWVGDLDLGSGSRSQTGGVSDLAHPAPELAANAVEADLESSNTQQSRTWEVKARQPEILSSFYCGFIGRKVTGLGRIDKVDGEYRKTVRTVC